MDEEPNQDSDENDSDEEKEADKAKARLRTMSLMPGNQMSEDKQFLDKLRQIQEERSRKQFTGAQKPIPEETQIMQESGQANLHVSADNGTEPQPGCSRQVITQVTIIGFCF